MRYAIFSDIHNDLTALSTVLDHANAQKVDAFFCLGDVGIDECVTRVRAVNAPTMFGNWEVSNWRYLSPENQRWVLNLPAIRKEGQFWLTHAAPLWPPKLATLADLNNDPYFIPRSKLFPYLHLEGEALRRRFTLYLVKALIQICSNSNTEQWESNVKLARKWLEKRGAHSVFASYLSAPIPDCSTQPTETVKFLGLLQSPRSEHPQMQSGSIPHLRMLWCDELHRKKMVHQFFWRREEWRMAGIH